jgi:isopenicillin N synthase-like dioxygenase
MQKFRGYTPLGAEEATGTEQDLGSEQKTVSEAFDIGYETAMDLDKKPSDPLPPDAFELYGDNQWPDEDVIPGFAKTYLDYCGIVLETCRKMMRIFALALELPKDFFDSKMRHPGVTSRMLHYPAQSVQGEEQGGLGAHTVRWVSKPLKRTRLTILRITNASRYSLKVVYRVCKS